jgi:hypothetical protein
MSAWPKTRKVGNHEVEFTKIRNRKLVNIVNKLAFAAAAAGIGGGGSAPSSPSDDDKSGMMDIFSAMQKNGDYESMQDTFYAHMIIPGVVGNILDDYETLFDREDIETTYDMELTVAAMDVYVSGFSQGKDGKAPKK